MIKYTIAHATSTQIYNHLLACDNSFRPRLSTRVNLVEFADKIFNKTVSFEAWDKDLLVGLVACYLNDYVNHTGYINHVSTLSTYHSCGIATQLLRNCLRFASCTGFQTIGLEVAEDNIRAQALYTYLGFTITRCLDQAVYMERSIHV